MIGINKHISKWEKRNHSYMNMNSGIYLVKKKNERKEMYQEREEEKQKRKEERMRNVKVEEKRVCWIMWFLSLLKMECNVRNVWIQNHLFNLERVLFLPSNICVNLKKQTTVMEGK